MMLQYKVPQNVGIEDRIVGPLTLKQLIVLAVGIGISYVLFAILSNLYELNILEYIVIGLPAAIAAAAALIKINDVTFTKYLLLVLEYSIKPKKRLWDHRGISALSGPELAEAKAPTAETTSVGPKKAVNLESLGRILDSGGVEHVDSVEHKDIDKTEDDLLLPQAFFGATQSPTENMYWRTADSHKKRLEILGKISSGSAEQRQVQAQVLTEHIETILEKAETQATSANRKRNKKRAVTPPARPGAQINTTQKNQPVQYQPPARSIIPPPMENPTPDVDHSGEFNFEELKQGEIEINLD